MLLDYLLAHQFKILRDNIGIAGHSLGGWSALAAADTDSRSVPTDAGAQVALSGDGNTVLLGDNLIDGAWVYHRNGSVWTFQGKLTGGPQSIEAETIPVALSYDGNTALIAA